MRISPAHKADHPEIIQVWEASVRATHHFLTEADIRFFRPLIRDQYLDAVDLYRATDEAGTIHGFLGVADGTIEMLFLRPESRGAGLGRELVRFAVDRLGARRVDVNEQNPDALGFYRHLGFRVTGRSPVDPSGKPYPLLHLELG